MAYNNSDIFLQITYKNCVWHVSCSFYLNEIHFYFIFFFTSVIYFYFYHKYASWQLLISLAPTQI